MRVRRSAGRYFGVALSILLASVASIAPASAADPKPSGGLKQIPRPTVEDPASVPEIEPASHALAGHETYQDGDLLISTSDLQWRLPDGTLNLSIDTPNNGGVGFGIDGSLYLTQFQYGSNVAKYDTQGRFVASYPLGSCQDPASVHADSQGNILIGSGGNLNCIYKYITKWGPADNLIANYTPISDGGWEHGPGWLAIQADDCVVRYSTGLSTIRRYNICTSTQLSNFSNSVSQAYGLQILPDGGMLVANWSNILRLNASGQVVRTYDAPNESSWYALALDLDGQSFWAASVDNAGDPAATNIVFKFDVSTGAQITSFNTGATGGVWGLAVYDSSRFGTPPSVPIEQTFGGAGSTHGARPFAFVAEPVNSATGSYTTQTTDFALPGRGLTLGLIRTYNSADPTSGVLGQGWTHSYAVRLETNPDGSVLFVDEGGARLLFPSNGSGGFIAPIGSGDTLTSTAGGYELRRRDHVVYSFDAGGRLTSLADRNGNAMGFAYSNGLLATITDTVGRQVHLTYTSGRLSGVSGPPSRSVSYTYDVAGRLETVTDVRGKTTTYAYDPSGRLATIVDANDHTVVTNLYGPDGRVSEQIDARGFHSTYDWDAETQTSTMTDARGGTWVDQYHDNVLLSRTDPLGNQTRYVYDDALNVIVVSDPRGNATVMSYDANRNMLTRIRPGSLGYPAEVWTYNARNDVLTYKDGRGNTTTNQYDGAGNLTKVTAPLDSIVEYGRDPAGTGLLFSIKDPRGKTTTFGYDAQANRNRVTTHLGNVTTTTFDPAGRMLTLVEPRGNVTGANPAQFTTTFTYDEGGNVLTTTDALGHATVKTYDDVGNRLTVTDPNDHTVTSSYDEANNLASVTDARDGVTRYAYDEVGNLIERLDAKDHQTTYGYDLAGRLISTTDALNHGWSMTYDAAGNVATRTDANGKVTTYTYDAVNRLTKVTYAATTTPTTTYAYDANGNRTTMTDGSGTETYVYDALNRLTSATRGTTVFSYGYNLAGNVTSRTYPGQAAQALVYDDDGRLISANGTTFTYDASSNPLTATSPDGFTDRRTYDRAGRLVEVAHTRSTGTLSRFTYGLDPAGNRVAMTTRQGTVTYRYDELDRLTEACWSATTCPGGAPATPLPCMNCVGGLLTRPAATTNPPAGETFRTYTYDPVGNRSTEVSNAGTTTYAYDAADRLLSTTAPGSVVTNYAFDNNGNQTAAGPRTFTYDLADRLKTAVVGTTTETYTYAGDGLRLSASTGSQANKTTKFLWDRSFGLAQLAVERSGSDSLLRSYAYGLDLLNQKAGNSTYWYHHDGLGSVVDVTGSTGTSVAWTDYYPYGVVRQQGKAGGGNGAPAVQPFNFAGEQLDTLTGLYYLRARQYDPGTGRFLSTDPAAPSPSSGCVSGYVYGGNNPARYIDPSGGCPIAILFGIVGGAAGSVVPVAGTAAGAAGAASVGFALCAAEVAVEVLVIYEATKPSEPIWDPRLDPQTQRNIIELLKTLEVDIHTGLPGGGRLPEVCKLHPTACKVALLALTGIVGLMLIIAGGPEALEEMMHEEHEDPEGHDEDPK